jgi:hypothetical protein
MYLIGYLATDRTSSFWPYALGAFFRFLLKDRPLLPKKQGLSSPTGQQAPIFTLRRFLEFIAY